MSKNRKAKLIERVDGKKLCLVASINNENDIIVDSRSKMPVGVLNGQDTVYMQEVNRIEFDNKNSKQNNILGYYAPNNVGILLSIANKALFNAQKIYNDKIDPNKYNHTDTLDGTSANGLSENTLIVYEFIEAIQTSIVFGYTAIESFTNLSIKENYQYKNVINNKGIIEIYDKKAIERWLSLDVKISNILVDIYQSISIKEEKIWREFKEFEECRNQIIHQKSIDINRFYEVYFNQEIFEICSVPEKIIKYFFEKGIEKGVNNVLWPLVVNTVNPIQVFGKTKKISIEYAGILSDY